MRPSWVAPIFLLPPLLFGCASLHTPTPGKHVGMDDAERWGCDWERLRERIEWRKENLPEEGYWIPSTEWDVCELLAAVGAPDHVETVKAYGITSYYLWYNYRSEVEFTKLVLLDGTTNRIQVGRW